MYIVYSGIEVNSRLSNFLSAPPQKHLHGAFHPRKHVIDGLAPQPHEFSTNDFWNEIGRHLEDLPGFGAVEPLAEDRCHRSGQRLHLVPERNLEVRTAAFVVDVQVDTDGVGVAQRSLGKTIRSMPTQRAVLIIAPRF